MPPDAAISAPRDLRKDPALLPLVDVLQKNFSQQALRELDPVFQGAGSASRTGGHIELKRDKPLSIPLGGEFLNGNIRATALEVGNISFDFDENRKTASNIQGISLTIDVFGSLYSHPVRKLQLTNDDKGGKVLRVDMESPLPAPAERVVGLPRNLTIDVPITENGLSMPKLSKIFTQMASLTDSSISGLLASDALKEGAKVAYFIESNPEWINTILQPVLHELYKAISPGGPGGHATNSQPADNTPVAPADNTGRPNDQRPAPDVPVDVPTKPGDHVYKMNIAGAERTYHVHVPTSYNGATPMPVVIILHGHAQDGAEIARHTGLSALAEKKGFIAIYPDARKWAGREEWRAWDTGNGLLPIGAKADDLSFLRQIIDKTQRDLLVDDKRIYMAGLSNGGMMTFRAAGELSDKLAAIAVISSAMSGSEPPPRQPLSVLNIHGTADSLIPYDGLKNVPASLTAVGLPKFQPTPYATNYWVEQNKIANPPLVLKDGNVTQRRFIDSKTGVEVNEYTIDGGEHVPDKVGELTERVWQFFESHPKAAGTTSGTLQPAGEEPFNLTERIKAHARQRGVAGIEIDVGKMLNEVQQIGDGSFSPSTMIKGFEERSGIQLEDTVTSFFKNTNEIAKRKQHISMRLQSPWRADLNEEAGPFVLTAIRVDNPSCDLITDNSCPAMRNIKGISFDLKALGSNYDVAVLQAAQRLDSNGAPYYKVDVRNPIPTWARILMISNSEIPIELKFDSAARPHLLNERQIKDAALGYNPVVRGYIDFGTHVHDLFAAPSWKSAGHVVKDVALFGGAGWGGYRAAAYLKYGVRGRIGGAVGLTVLVAPTAIHLAERLLR